MNPSQKMTFPILVGGEEECDERTLLTKVESGLLMSGADAVRFIVIHCSATRCDRDYPVEQLLHDHKARGFRTIGYHFYIRRSGSVTRHRKLLEVGAHIRGLNRCSLLRRRTGCERHSRRHPYSGAESPAGRTVVETSQSFSKSADSGTSRPARR